MYHGSVKLSELEEEIGKEKLNEFIANIQDAFGEKEKVYFNFLSYDRFEDRYTDPAIEKKFAECLVIRSIRKGKI